MAFSRKGALSSHAHRIRQRQVHRASSRAHPQPHQPVRRQALSGIRRKAVRRLPCRARAARVRARLQDPHAQKPCRRGGDHHRHQRQRHREEQGPRRLGHHLRRGRAAPHGHLPLHGLRHQRRGDHPLREPTLGRRVPPPPGKPGHQKLPALPYRRLSVRHRPHRQRRGLRQERIRGNDAPPRGGDGARPRLGQDGHVPVAAVPRA